MSFSRMTGTFIPLGGADEIGASAYFLSLDGVNILLDCGARLKGEELYPDYNRLLAEMSDLAELDLILISHGHYDHIGSFARIARLAPRAQIAATGDTAALIRMQLLELGRISGRGESERVTQERYRRAQALMDRIRIVNVMESFEARGIRITFLPAGHMIGAAMIRLETPRYDVLYSGDFSMRTMYGINAIRIPEGLRPGVFLVNAPNVYLDREEWDAYFSGEERALPEGADSAETEERIRSSLEAGRNVYLYSRSIPRHLDLFCFLKDRFPDVPVVLEKKSKVVAEALADMGYAVCAGKRRIEDGQPMEPCIVVGQEEGRYGCVPVCFDRFSLHASPRETAELIGRMGARQNFLLHVYPDKRKVSPAGCLEKRDGISVLQAQNGMKYYLKRNDEMTYEKIYRDAMRNELPRAAEQLRKNRGLTQEWAAIYGSLRCPQRHPREAWQQMQADLAEGRRISYSDYVDALRTANLDAEEKRCDMLARVERGAELLKAALNGDRTAAGQYAEFTENLAPRDKKNRKTIFVGKALVVFLLLLDPDLKSGEYMPIARSYGAHYCDRLLRNLRDILLKEYGIRGRRRNARDVLEKTEAAISENAEAASGFTADSELEELRFMNSNYKNSLELVQSMLDELNRTIDETAEDARNAAIVSFYALMNSEKYGHLLDGLELVERRLSDLKEQKVKLPPQAMPLTIVFKQLLRFVRDCEITPIETTGRTFEAEFEELENYTYIGEAYTKAGERKTVTVEKPGWKYRDAVISLPTVREKEEE